MMVDVVRKKFTTQELFKWNMSDSVSISILHFFLKQSTKDGMMKC